MKLQMTSRKPRDFCLMKFRSQCHELIKHALLKPRTAQEGIVERKDGEKKTQFEHGKDVGAGWP